MATKFRGFRALGIVGFAALAVTAVSACSGNGIAASNPATGPAVTSSPATVDPGADSRSLGGSVTPPVAVSASLSKCLPGNLRFVLGGSGQRGQNQWVQTVDMTNHGSSSCTMDGVPGVDLIGDKDSQASDDWTLAASSAPGGGKVTLRPGATAHFDLVYLSGDLASGGADENVIAVHKMVITTPGQPDRYHIPRS